MSIKQKLFFFIILIAVHSIIILPIIYFSMLLIGKADVLMVVIFGVINALFARKIFKGYVFFSAFLGFLISGASICLVYLISYFAFGSNPNYGVMFYIMMTVLIWIVIIQNDWKIKNQKKLFFIILLPTLFFLIMSFFLKEIYPSKFENKNLTSTKIKIIDRQKIPKSGDSIEVRIDLQPLFGMKESQEIYKTITNDDGIAKIQLSKSRNYTLFINTKGNNFIIYDINSKDLKNKKEFIIEDK